jgi:hypothetical protein
MKYPRILTLMSLAVLLVVGLWSAAFGQSNDGNLANVIGGGSSVRFEVVAQNAGVTLTITAPDGRSFTKEYKAGSSPGFEFGDRSLPDGSYGYELRLRPALTAGQREALKDARGKDDDPEAERAARKRPVLPNMVQSGAFALTNGQVIVGGLSENQRTGKSSVAPASKPASSSEVASGNTAARLRNHRASLFSSLMFDQVIPDDLIVQGSACVGLDCVNNESFGFDTIRLKENNTRIKFDDTSVSAGFPANDWQLTANDSASGGASKFSIEDITGSKVPFTIRAGAATNSIFVDSTGRLGLRTSTPVLDIHAATSNTPALRLEQNNSGGFTAQTWDIGANEANFFVRDVTGGSRLPFRIRPGAPTSSVDISADGSVGIGTASPNFQLDVTKNQNATTSIGVNNSDTNASSRSQVSLTSGSVTGRLLTINNDALYLGTTTSNGVNLQSAGLNALSIDTSQRVGIGTSAPSDTLSVNGTASKPGGGTWAVFSDERLKNIKGNFRSGLKAVMQLTPIRYEYLKNNALGIKSDGEHIGFGAQSLQKVIPEAVTMNSEGYLMVNSDPIIWTMLNAIKEQQKEIEQLKGQIKKLQTTSHRRRK